jgi:hypothetical protein
MDGANICDGSVPAVRSAASETGIPAKALSKLCKTGQEGWVLASEKKIAPEETESYLEEILAEITISASPDPEIEELIAELFA